MPYSFTKIEEDKSKIIGFVFFFLIGIYFLGFWFIGCAVKVYSALQEYSRVESFTFLNVFESLAVLGLALAAGTGHWFYTISGIIPRISGILKAEPPDKNDQYHQMFSNIVEEVSVATGGRTIGPVVVPSMAMNAFALTDFEGRAVIGVTEGLLSRLTRAQLEAVVGHEAAHIVCGDSLSTSVCVSMFNLYGGLLAGLEKMLRSQRRSSSRKGGGIAGLLVIIYLILVITRFLSRLMAMFISRQREYRADAVSVRLTRDPLALAEALYAITNRWRGSGLPAQELEAIFIVNPAYSSLDEETGFFPDLFSTHPPVENRLRILLDMAHTNVESLETSLKKQMNKPRTFLPESAGAPAKDSQAQPRYMLHKEGAWVGPFDLSQIGTFEWVRPDMWIERLDKEGVKMAYEDEQIQSLFKKPQDGGDPGLRCPRCRILLNKQPYEGVEVDQCPFCRGVLVGQQDVEKFILRQEIGFPEHVTRIAQGTKKEQLMWGDAKIKKDPKTLYVCPQCRTPAIQMVRMFYSPAYHVEVDKCVFCGTIWFDKDELEVLQCLIEQATDIQ